MITKSLRHSLLLVGKKKAKIIDQGKILCLSKKVKAQRLNNLKESIHA
jgi:hypothetical protein